MCVCVWMCVLACWCVVRRVLSVSVVVGCVDSLGVLMWGVGRRLLLSLTFSLALSSLDLSLSFSLSPLAGSPPSLSRSLSFVLGFRVQGPG